MIYLNRDNGDDTGEGVTVDYTDHDGVLGNDPELRSL